MSEIECPPLPPTRMRHRGDKINAVERGWLDHGWRPMREAPTDAGHLMLLVPTRWAKRSTHIQTQGEWLGDFWVIFNSDEAVQRVEPVGWRPLHQHPAASSKTPNVGANRIDPVRRGNSG